jgi:hypothetical protein
MTSQGEISIWFFIGISLLVNGALITAAGLYEWLIKPAANPVVLYHLHANVWWGALLFILGVFYSWHFAPSRTRRAAAAKPSSPNREEIHV